RGLDLLDRETSGFVVHIDGHLGSADQQRLKLAQPLDPHFGQSGTYLIPKGDDRVLVVLEAIDDLADNLINLFVQRDNMRIAPGGQRRKLLAQGRDLGTQLRILLVYGPLLFLPLLLSLSGPAPVLVVGGLKALALMPGQGFLSEHSRLPAQRSDTVVVHLNLLTRRSRISFSTLSVAAARSSMRVSSSASAWVIKLAGSAPWFTSSRPCHQASHCWTLSLR